jgi:SH3 domain-containing YSC84-like protein 1
MNSKLGRSMVCALCVGVVFCLAAVATPAQDYQQPYSQTYTQPRSRPYSQMGLSPRPVLNGDELDNAMEGSVDTAEVFRNIAVARNEIPQDVLDNAAAIGVFKGIFNLAFIGGYSRGDGAISVRTPSGWSAPVFYKMRGGFGLDADASPTDYLLVFMSRESIKDIADGEFDLDHDANVVAGPIMEGTAGHPEFSKSKTVFVYSRGKGSLASAVIDGAKLTARDSVNLDLYGADALALLSDPSQLPQPPQLSDMCAACLEPGASDLSQTAGAAMARQPAYVAGAQSPTTMREDLALNAPAPHNRGRGVKVIVIKIINEDEDEEDDEENDGCRQVMVVRPQLQPVCCPRLHKKKL